jgi:hypothetical protein
MVTDRQVRSLMENRLKSPTVRAAVDKAGAAAPSSTFLFWGTARKAFGGRQVAY